MKSSKKEPATHEMQIPILDFLKYYNQNTPEGFPRVSVALLEKFKNTHLALFKHGDLWSLDQHRKKIIDWLPLNGNISS